MRAENATAPLQFRSARLGQLSGRTPERPLTTLAQVPLFRRKKVAPRWARELPDGYVIRFNGRETRLTADEAMKLSEAVNDLFSEPSVRE